MTAPVVLVTGATDGIGLETALELARRGARPIVHGRNAAKLARARALVAAETKSAVPSLQADFASLEEVRGLVEQLEKSGERPTVLLNNAGIFARKREKSREGFELTFAVNHLAPFLLTHLLLQSPAGERLERIVNVSSMAHASGSIDLDDLEGMQGGFEGYSAYASSKLANVLFTVALAPRIAPRKIDTNALHPGVVSTNLLRAGFGMDGPDSVKEGAATSVHLALDPGVRGTTGRYFARRRETQPSAAARDVALARALYDRSCEMTGARPLPVT